MCFTFMKLLFTITSTKKFMQEILILIFFFFLKNCDCSLQWIRSFEGEFILQGDLGCLPFVLDV